MQVLTKSLGASAFLRIELRVMTDFHERSDICGIRIGKLYAAVPDAGDVAQIRGREGNDKLREAVELFPGRILGKLFVAPFRVNGDRFALGVTNLHLRLADDMIEAILHLGGHVAAELVVDFLVVVVGDVPLHDVFLAEPDAVDVHLIVFGDRDLHRIVERVEVKGLARDLPGVEPPLEQRPRLLRGVDPGTDRFRFALRLWLRVL